MTYAISKGSALKAPKVPNGEPYVLNKSLLGTNYDIYVHSYLSYGQLAARTEIFKASGNSSSSPCILGGYSGYYTYNGVDYKASSPKQGSSLKKCSTLAKKALKIKAPCKHKKCTFGGIWMVEVGIIDPKKPFGRAKPIQYLYAAKLAFNTKVKDIKSVFPNIDERNIPFICMDLVYEYTLLADGFGLNMVSEFIARGQCSKWWFGLKKGVNRDQLGSVMTYEVVGIQVGVIFMIPCVPC
uniref:Apyrase 3 n=1 Tax=Solanum tuberosum TaxID=4113 RepID=M1DSL8_SOLTU